MIKKIETPLTEEKILDLHSGDIVYLSGVIYTARDAAHKILVQMIENNEELPFKLENQVIYYVGPSPAKPGSIIGSCGPTTSSRMDAYSGILLKKRIKRNDRKRIQV